MERLPSDARLYVGTKIISAWPERKNGEDGYHVVYPDKLTGYCHSWSPKRQFEMAYREVDLGEKLMWAEDADREEANENNRLNDLELKS